MSDGDGLRDGVAIPTWLKLAQVVVDRCLRLDSEFAEGLAVLAGRRVVVRVMPSGPAVEAHIVAGGVILAAAGGSEVPDVTIAGTLPALAALLERGDVLPAGVHVSGELAVLQTLRAELGRLQVDWEEILAEQLGDVSGHQAARALRALGAWSAGCARAVARGTSEYLVEEARALPARVLVERFYFEVDEIRDDVERLDRRVARLVRLAAERGR